MIHAREDYNGVDLNDKIPKDEPVFLLRAQDPFAARAVSYYAAQLRGAARNEDDLKLAESVEVHAELMDRWPNAKAYPDAPGINGRPVAAAADEWDGPPSKPSKPPRGAKK